MSYEKHHSPSNQAIPEDEQQEVQVRVVRQIKGVDSNKLQPIIRFHSDKDFKIPPYQNEYAIFDYKKISNSEWVDKQELLQQQQSRKKTKLENLQKQLLEQNSALQSEKSLSKQKNSSNFNNNQLKNNSIQQKIGGGGVGIRKNGTEFSIEIGNSQNEVIDIGEDEEEEDEEQNEREELNDISQNDDSSQIELNEDVESVAKNKKFAQNKINLKRPKSQIKSKKKVFNEKEQQFIEDFLDNNEDGIEEEVEEDNIIKEEKGKSTTGRIATGGGINNNINSKSNIPDRSKIHSVMEEAGGSSSGKLLMMQQLRGNSSSAMARQHPSQLHQSLGAQTQSKSINNSQVTTNNNNEGSGQHLNGQLNNGIMIQNQSSEIIDQQLNNRIYKGQASMIGSAPDSITQQTWKNKSQIENALNNNGESPFDKKILREQMIQGSAGGNPRRRFKNNGNQQQQQYKDNANMNMTEQQQQQMILISSQPNQQQQQIPTQRPRNDKQKQNSSSKEHGQPQKLMAPITDIRQKKQSSTINVDEISQIPSKKYIEQNNNTIAVISAGPPLSKNKSKGKDMKNQNNDSLFMMENSFDKDMQFQKLNQSSINNMSLNNSLVNNFSSSTTQKGQKTGGSSSKGRTSEQAQSNKQQKFIQQQQQQQLLQLFANQSNPDSLNIINLVKKREKLNHSALGTHSTKSNQNTNDPNPAQFSQQISKLYSQKRTPTANASQYATAQTKKSSSKSKDKAMKFAAFTQEMWNNAGNAGNNVVDQQKLAQFENIKRAQQLQQMQQQQMSGNISKQTNQSNLIGGNSNTGNKKNSKETSSNSREKQGAGGGGNMQYIYHQQQYPGSINIEDDFYRKSITSQPKNTPAPPFIYSQTQYENWMQFQNKRQNTVNSNNNTNNNNFINI